MASGVQIITNNKLQNITIMSANVLYDKFVKEYGYNESLIYAVYDQLGCDCAEEFFQQCQDVVRCSCGANGGFTGFYYHKTTAKFFLNNRDEIIKLAKSERLEFSCDSVIGMVSKFKSCSCYEECEIALTLYGNEDQICQGVADTMAKYALEEVAHWVDNFLNEEGNDLDED